LGLKTGLPQAELSRIERINQEALTSHRQASSRYDSASQILLLTACPLPGVTGMTRVTPFAGRSYQRLMAGLAILFATILAAAALLTRLLA
jgi:hypothetical protein